MKNDWGDKTRCCLLILLSCFLGPTYLVAQAPQGFVDIKQVNSDIVVDLRYYSTNNFVGDTIDGYQAPVIYISEPAARALNLAQEKLVEQGFGLKLFDGYRPQRSVDHFARWARDLEDTLMKRAFYPEVDKSVLFRDGYIASRSGHTRGSTVDLTLIDLSTRIELDMGSPFDRFDPISYHGSGQITRQQSENRRLLKEALESSGFRAYEKEWWHYTLNQEPYPDTYFDFMIRE